MLHKRLAIFVLLVALQSYSVIAGGQQRMRLGYDQLMSSENGTVMPVANKYFLPPKGAAEARQQFSGRIIIPEHGMQTSPTTIEPPTIVGKRTQLFPGIALNFVSHGEYLLPVERELLAPTESDSFWQIQLAPGRTWSEEDDNGMSRASLPFFLTSNIENESYNGVATFLYNDKSVSELRYQIVQQLTPFLVTTWFTAATQLPVRYEPGEIDSAELVAEFEEELQDQLVWRNWSELEDRYGAELFSDFNSGIDTAKVVASGLIIDDEVYVHSIGTPYGDYPYPREMRHGIWSMTKTLAGLVTLARMAEKYGDEILDFKIEELLDVTASHDGYDEVTLGHAMNMATGIGTGSEDVDPNNISDGYIYSDFEAYVDWYLAPTIAEKLEHTFRVQSHAWGPGEHARYRDRDTVLLAAALDSLYRRKEGNDADLWQMMLDEVYRPLGIHHMPKNLTKESDRPGVPFLGWGLYVTVDDIGKIAGLILDGGQLNGRQVLSKAVLAEAMYETDVRGLPTGSTNEFGDNSYHLSFWHENYTTSTGKTYTIPTMSGWGGNIVKLMPNGIIGFRIGNGGEKPVEQMIIVADRIRPFGDYERRRIE